MAKDTEQLLHITAVSIYQAEVSQWGDYDFARAEDSFKNLPENIEEEYLRIAGFVLKNLNLE
jgi:hypothetical protein